MFHVRPTKVLNFTIKLNKVKLRNKIKTLLFSFLKTLPISANMLLLLQSQTRVIFKSHPKLSVLFCNHISWCKKWTEKPFPCFCSSLFSTLNLSPQNGHISVLGHETSSIHDVVLHANLNNVCSPNVKSFPEEFFDSFLAFYDDVFDFCETFKEPICFIPFSKPSTWFKNKGFNHLNEILNTFATQPSFIWKLFKNLTLSLKLLTLLHISPHMHKCYKLNLLFQSLFWVSLTKTVGSLTFIARQSSGMICTTPFTKT